MEAGGRCASPGLDVVLKRFAKEAVTAKLQSHVSAGRDFLPLRLDAPEGAEAAKAYLIFAHPVRRGMSLSIGLSTADDLARFAGRTDFVIKHQGVVGAATDNLDRELYPRCCRTVL